MGEKGGVMRVERWMARAGCDKEEGEGEKMDGTTEQQPAAPARGSGEKTVMY